MTDQPKEQHLDTNSPNPNTNPMHHINRFTSFIKEKINGTDEKKIIHINGNRKKKSKKHIDCQTNNLPFDRDDGSDQKQSFIDLDTTDGPILIAIDRDAQDINEDPRLDQIINDVNDIRDISTDMAYMLYRQGDQLCEIDNNVEQTSIDLKLSDEELKKAIRSKNNMEAHLVSCTTGAIIGSIFGPIGASVGAVVGFASSTAFNFAKKSN
jgi:hypothetical protein